MNNDEILRSAVIQMFERLVQARETLQDVVTDNQLYEGTLCVQNVGQFQSYLRQTIFPCLSSTEQERMTKLFERYNQTAGRYKRPVDLHKTTT